MGGQFAVFYPCFLYGIKWLLLLATKAQELVANFFLWQPCNFYRWVLRFIRVCLHNLAQSSFIHSMIYCRTRMGISVLVWYWKCTFFNAFLTTHWRQWRLRKHKQPKVTDFLCNPHLSYQIPHVAFSFVWREFLERNTLTYRGGCNHKLQSLAEELQVKWGPACQTKRLLKLNFQGWN